MTTHAKEHYNGVIIIEIQTKCQAIDINKDMWNQLFQFYTKNRLMPNWLFGDKNGIQMLRFLYFQLDG